MSEFHDDRTAASDPQPITLSDAKLRRLQPELYGWRTWFTRAQWGGDQLTAHQARRMLAEHMSFGDTRAAVVVQTSPLVVAAYTDEQDAVLLLRFPGFVAESEDLPVGAQLLTVNTYGRGTRLAADLIEGPASTGRYTNFHPVIAEFVSNDRDLIERRKMAISTDEWRRTLKFGKARLAVLGPQRARDGRPLQSFRPVVLTSGRK